MIPDEIIEQVRDAADIVQIIGEHVELKKQGTDFRGPCPFHQGTHRNFSVSPKKNMFYCFVCGEGGDVFAFLQKHLGIEWPAAVRLVAERVGIEIRETSVRREGPDPREPLWELNATAAEFFTATLWEGDDGRAAREYLKSRGIDREMADRVSLGFAPRDAGAMREHMARLGFDDARLLEGGLLVQPDGGGEPRARFRGRLMFPIHDISGHVVGFGGRLLGPGDPKYLNSSESPIFSKGKLLYGLYWARNAIRREDRVLLVEGYMDVIRLMSAGIDPVVAPLGTSLTEAQAALLRRQTLNVYLLYDSDRAGLKATFRAGDELLRTGAAVQVVTLPEGEDPDSFVAKHGANAMEALVSGAIDVFDRKVQLLERAGWFADLRRKRRAIDRLLPSIRAASDPLMRDLYLSRAAAAAGVSKELLERESLAAARITSTGGTSASGVRPGDQRAGGPGSPAHSGAGSQGDRRRTPDRRGTRIVAGAASERALVGALLHHRNRVESVAERIGPEDIRHPDYAAIYEALLTVDPDASIEELSASLPPAAMEALHELLAEPGAFTDPDRTIAGAMARLDSRRIDARLREIDELLRLASEQDKSTLTMEKKQLEDERRALGGPPRWKQFQ